MKRPSAPERIYLQVPDDCDDYADAANGEVTWCVDKINDGDVEYVRADLVGELAALKLEEEATSMTGFSTLKLRGSLFDAARYLRSLHTTEGTR